MAYEKSLELYQRASKSISGGLHSNGRYRTPWPIYFKQAAGAYITDIDDNKYIDLLMGNGSIILGHNNPDFQARMNEYMTANGHLITGFDSLLSVETAEKFIAITGHERVRFANTGTEAINHCIRIARAYTGKENIAVMEGGYNGWTDAVFVNSFAPLSALGPEEHPASIPGTGGIDQRIADNTVVLPFNNIEASRSIISEHADDLAAIILEPVMIDIGYIEAQPEYIAFLRKICDEHNILLIFDELLAGFRIALGGCQEFYNTQSDLAIFGKAFANGYIISAVAGKSKYMDISAPGGKTAYQGTFNGHHVSLCAAAATLDMLADGQITKSIISNNEYLKKEFNYLAAKLSVPAQMTGRGGHFHVYFTAANIYNYRTAATTDRQQYKVYVDTMQQNGVWCAQNPLSHHVLSYAHSRDVLDQILSAAEKSLRAVANSYQQDDMAKKSS